jgi:hypothetical protein
MIYKIAFQQLMEGAACDFHFQIPPSSANSRSLRGGQVIFSSYGHRLAVVPFDGNQVTV